MCSTTLRHSGSSSTTRTFSPAGNISQLSDADSSWSILVWELAGDFPLLTLPCVAAVLGKLYPCSAKACPLQVLPACHMRAWCMLRSATGIRLALAFRGANWLDYAVEISANLAKYSMSHPCGCNPINKAVRDVKAHSSNTRQSAVCTLTVLKPVLLLPPA